MKAFRAVSPDFVLAEWMGLPRFRTFQVSRGWVFKVCLHNSNACMGRELPGHTPPSKLSLKQEQREQQQ